MGGALLTGWREVGLAPSYVVDPRPPEGVFGDNAPHVTFVRQAEEIPPSFRPASVILAVKPQNAAATLPAYAGFAADAVFLSIMAGRSTRGMRDLLGAGAAVVRAMPNTPAAVRKGVTVATAGPDVTKEQRQLCDQLLNAIGIVEWVDDEGLIDPVTAISGGGPAYVFLLAELLEKAGIAQGLSPALARTLARQTVSGSGALLAASAEESDALRRAVTSPNGTTERALAVLMAEGAWPVLMSRAIADATARSRELAD
jgi:pyrroline-5-carboxylate reductase